MSSHRQTIAAAALIALTFVLLTLRTWGGWADPQIDFGNELYIAWQLAEGQTLYKDIAHKNGPLSHTLNAGLFRMFGTGIRTLIWANLAVLAACCALAFAILRRFAGLAGATTAVLAFLCVFAFGQYVDVANYNFVTPYHHFQTHGIALGLLELFGLLRALESGRRRYAVLAGLSFGALFLTKIELWLPGLVAAAGWVALVHRQRSEATARLTFVFGLASLALPLLFLIGLAAEMPSSDALRGLLGNLTTLRPELAQDAFYRSGAGLDAPAAGMLRIGLATLVLAAIAGAIVTLDRALADRPAYAASWGGAALVALIAWFAVPKGTWFASAGALPVVAVLAAALAARVCLRAKPAELGSAHPALFLWAVWAGALLIKLLLAPRFHHYGFALAMPAGLLLVAGFSAGLPEIARRLGGSGRVATALATSCVAVAVIGILTTSLARYDAKTLWIGPEHEALRVDAPERAPRAALIEQLRRRLAALMPKDASLLVYPEGALLNYWLRRPSSSRFVFFLPTELDAFGREAVREDLRQHPPDFVVLAHRGHAEFGVGPFGEDPRNGRGIVDWVRANYERIENVGAPPFRARGFGAEIWRRRSPVQNPTAPGAT